MSLIQVLVVVASSILGLILGIFIGRKALKKIDI